MLPIVPLYEVLLKIALPVMFALLQDEPLNVAFPVIAVVTQLPEAEVNIIPAVLADPVKPVESIPAG